MKSFKMAASVAVILFAVTMTMARDVPVFDVSNASPSFHESDDYRYFRYLMLDDVNGALYVGARDNVYRLNLTDVSSQGAMFKKSQDLPSRADDIYTCRNSHEDVECSNHIRVLVVQGDYIYGCGTGSQYPVEFKLHRQTLIANGTYPPTARDSGMMKCPHTPSGSYAAVYVENGNPDDIPSLYSATVSRLTDFKQVVSRPTLDLNGREMTAAIRTVNNNAVVFKWLNEASFVATFETAEYMYVFFNEIASEFSMMVKNVPRVARICKNDRGGRKYSVLDDHWTTFIKVRLNCSLPGSEVFYFDVLRDVLRIEKTYYALFTTPESAINGSAICEFTQTEIDAAFEGSFMEHGQWVEVEDSDVPDPRPGTCNADSKSLSNNNINFIASHPLMYNALSPQRGQPLYYMPQDLASKLMVKTVNTNNQYLVFYLVTVDARIHKVAYQSSNGGQAKHVVTMRPFGFTEPTVYSAVSHGDWLYLSTDLEVKQVSVETCSSYYMCTDCVQDPHCRWSQMDGCVKATGSMLFQSVFGDPLDTCRTAGACYMQPQSHYVSVPGDAIHLTCESRCDPNDDSPIQWYHTDGVSNLVTPDNSHKLMLTTTNGLVIFNTTFANAGLYECKSGTVLLAEHSVSIPDCDASDQKCIWETEFDRWCSEFETYRDNYNHWLCAKNQCLEHGNCEPDQISDAQCPMT